MRGPVAALGIKVLGVGVKDVILPGEMKELLNGNAMRSALDTAN